MTLITWLREEKAATEQTSICQLCSIGNAHFTRGIRTYGADAAGQGWELSSTRIMILSSGSQKWNINFFLIAMIFPFPYSRHPAHRTKTPSHSMHSKTQLTWTHKTFFMGDLSPPVPGSSLQHILGLLSSSFWLNIFEVCCFHRLYFPTSVSFVLGNTLSAITQSLTI